MNIPDDIKKIIGNRAYKIDSLGMSSSQVVIYDDMVLKIEQQSEESDNEHVMLKWLADKLSVPEIIYSAKSNGINYLLMNRLKGELACSDELLKNPKYLTKLLAQGLNRLWRVDISNCPYNNNLDNKLRLAEANVENNLCDIEDAEPNTYGASGFANPAALLKWLKENRPSEELVFSHGDFCLPNIFINQNKVSGFIDLGRSGLADKYQDIALCYRSLLHDFDETYGGKADKGFDHTLLFDELEIIPDWEKIRYYILLDELF